MIRPIILRLTKKEADALQHAAGNSLCGDENEIMNLFNDDSIAIKAAMRAFGKLNKAIREGGAR